MFHKEIIDTFHFILLHFTDGPNNDTSVTVYNANRQFDPDGELDDITGFAFLTDEVGKLIVRLQGVPFDGDCKFTLEIF